MPHMSELPGHQSGRTGPPPIRSGFPSPLARANSPSLAPAPGDTSGRDGVRLPAARGRNRRRRRLRLPRLWAVGLLSLGTTAGLLAWEMRTSTLQALWFSKYADKLTWVVRPGVCARRIPAPPGPYDLRLGYGRLDSLQAKLTARDYQVASQACPSPELLRLAERGITPPYAEKQTGILEILDRSEMDLYRAPHDQYAFGSYESLPPVLVRSLLYVENRQLLDASRPTKNPAVEWDRLFFASTNYAIDKVVDTGGVQGGSTLATQIEKFRHSPEGRTSGGVEKARQVFAASLRAYREGEDTSAMRQEIVLNYMNSMPLGAATGVGEVTGLAQGMWAWFGVSRAQLVRDLELFEQGEDLRRTARTYKQALALVLATRRPTSYLAKNHSLLEQRLQSYLPLMIQDGVLPARLAGAVSAAPLTFLAHAPERPRVEFVDRKATNAVRAELLDILGVQDLYALDRYDLRVETSIDGAVQEDVTSTLRQLTDPAYLGPHGFYGKHLLATGDDPTQLIYSFSLYEASPEGNRLRVTADNLNKPLDINRNVKLELGSTAKLRTMANYLMVVASLHARFQGTPGEALENAEAGALDPLSRWAATWLREHRGATLAQTLEASLQRPFSADPGEPFFTGSGLHYFANFDDDIRGNTTLSTAFAHSVNLVYIRLMRELVQYYTAELDYDTRSILDNPNDPKRAELLDAAMDNEARTTLRRYYNRYRGQTYEQALAAMCGKDARGLRRLAIFALAENPDATASELVALGRRVYPAGGALQDSLLRTHRRSYARKVHNTQDEAYLLGRHPLDPWTVRALRDHPGDRWPEIVERSADARRAASKWIYPKRFKEAQNLRIRIELERRAFVEIHKAWQELGYPFDSLVPSLATAIGSSADRPQALAELVGIIQRGGKRVPLLRVEALHFAEGTPYETHFEPRRGAGEKVMPTEVAVALKGLMQAVVEGGTAVRVQGCLQDDAGKRIVIGGKTGSGDNRIERVASNGARIGNRAINRTASFVFVIGDRHFGMMTVYVDGEQAADYTFTSSLALQAFRMIARDIQPLVGAVREETERAAAGDTAAPSNQVAAGTPKQSPASPLARPTKKPVAIATRR